MDTPDQQLARKLDLILKTAADRTVLVTLATQGIALIRKRTLAGQFLEGSSPGADQYSTTPMPLPYGAIANKISKTDLKAGEASGKYRVFKSRKGNTWIVIEGGYRVYRQLAGKASDHVYMSWSGRMLRNLGIIEQGERELRVGEADSDMKQLAIWHNIMGAGKSKRKHVFMAFNDAEVARLGQLAGNEIAKKLVQKLG